MRKTVLIVLLLGALTGGVWAQAPPASQVPSLSEVQLLKADNLLLKVALLQAQQREIQAEAARLAAARVQLEQEFRATLRPAAGSVFDWQAKTFVVLAAPAEQGKP